jgi:Na+/pantothenate symporter
LAAVICVAGQDPDFNARLQQAGPTFLDILPPGGWPQAFGFVLGFGSAALGFGLGQPHIVSRYLAGGSPAETGAAWWIYMGFVQYTWAAMTAFGVVLRGVLPDLPDSEAGLSVFFQDKTNAIATGIIVADVFATIAATSNALLVAMGQALGHDLIPRLTGGRRPPLWVTSAGLGLVTMVLSLVLKGRVMSVTLAGVSMLAASIAPAMIVKVLDWPHSARSLIAAVLGGFAGALIWRAIGGDALVNEAFPGLLAGLAAQFLVHRIDRSGSLKPV